MVVTLVTVILGPAAQWPLAAAFPLVLAATVAPSEDSQAPPQREEVETALLAAEQMEAEHAYAPARRQVEALIALVPDDQRPGLRRRVCMLREKEGDRAGARACQRELATAVEDDHDRALARYHAGRLALDLGERQTAHEELEALIVELPQTEGAERALALLSAVRHEEAGDAGEADLLLGIASRLRAAGVMHGVRPLAAALVEAGRIRLEGRRDVASARSILDEARRVAVGTPWLDDAIYWSARAACSGGDTAAAVALYGQLIDAHEESWFVGSYQSERYDDALFEIAQVYEEQGDREAALAAYDRVPREVPTSRFVDDAAFAAARLRWARGERDALTDFASDYPTSRHAGEARQLAGERATP